MLSILKNLLKSIALVPSVLALSFFSLAILLTTVQIDYGQYDFFSTLIIEDSKDIQFVLTFVIGGIFTLTIFSYTMVMNVLNRNINNYSPRLIPLLLSEKHHQIILGFTSGTILYALVLSIALINEGSDYFPSIGAALAAIFSMVCVFLFIYFIHSVSKSIHINYILKEVYDVTLRQLKQRVFSFGNFVAYENIEHYEHKVVSDKSGVLRLYSLKNLKRLVDAYGFKIQVDKECGEFIFQNETIFRTDRKLNDKQLNHVRRQFAIGHEVAVDVHEVGFKHLVEVAIKASSPAINDAGTSKSCLDYLTQLFIHRLETSFDNTYIALFDERIYIVQVDTNKLLVRCFVELYRYLKNDPLLKLTLQNSLRKIQLTSGHKLELDWKKLKNYEAHL